MSVSAIRLKFDRGHVIARSLGGPNTMLSNRSLEGDPEAALAAAATERAQNAWQEGAHAAGRDFALDALAVLPSVAGGLCAPVEYWAARHLSALGQLQPALDHARHGLLECEPEDIETRAMLHCMAAYCLSEAGDHAAATAQAMQALTLGVQHDKPRIESLALCRIALCRWRQGDPFGAESVLFRALSLAREANSREEISLAINGLVGAAIATFHLANRLGDIAAANAALLRACDYSAQAVRLARREHSLEPLLAALNDQAKCLTMLGELETADSTLRDVIAQADARGLHLLSLRASYNLAMAQVEGGCKVEAKNLLEDVLRRSNLCDYEPMRRLCIDALAALKGGRQPPRAADSPDWEKR